MNRSIVLAATLRMALSVVAQTFSLLYRRFETCGRGADCKSAAQQATSLRYSDLPFGSCPTLNLTSSPQRAVLFRGTNTRLRLDRDVEPYQTGSIQSPSACFAKQGHFP